MTFSIIVYSAPSIFLFFCDCLMRRKTKRGVRVVSLISMSYLIFISSFRNNIAPYHVGADSNHFRTTYVMLNSGYASYTEWFYDLINRFLGSTLHLPPTSLFVVVSLLIGGCYYKFISRVMPTKYVFVGLFLYINSGIFFMQMNSMRQHMSTAFFILALLALAGNYIENNDNIRKSRKRIILRTNTEYDNNLDQVIKKTGSQKPKLQIISCSVWLLLAFLTHTIAILYALIALLLLLCKNVKFDRLKTILWIVFIASIVFMLFDARIIFTFLSKLIPGRLVMYLDTDFFTQRNIDAIVKQIVPCSILAYLLVRSPKYQNTDMFGYQILLFGFFLYVVLTNLFSGMVAFVRIGYMFDMFVCVAPFLCAIHTKQKLTNRFIKLAFYAYYSVLTIVTIYTFGGPGVMPYSFCF